MLIVYKSKQHGTKVYVYTHPPTHPQTHIQIKMKKYAQKIYWKIVN